MINKRISGFQWAMTIFVFFVITMTLSIILRDFQATVGIKHFVFDITDLAPLIAALICILVFKHKKTQLAGFKLSVNLKVVERMLLAIILPLIIFMIGMFSFNTFADSFILLQASDLSVPIIQILIGHLIMGLIVEFGFRSYLQNIVETKMNTFFASIVVGLLYSVFTANTTYGNEFAMYNFIYTFSFSMIVGELIRATGGRTIYIATIFHAAMTFGLVFLFSEEIGDLFSMKVIALSTALVAVVYILLSLVIRLILYFTTRKNLDEVEPNNYLDHVNDEPEEVETEREDTTSRISQDKEATRSDNLETNSEANQNAVQNNEQDLKTSSTYKEDRHSSAVEHAKEEIDDVTTQDSQDTRK